MKEYEIDIETKFVEFVCEAIRNCPTDKPLLNPHTKKFFINDKLIFSLDTTSTTTFIDIDVPNTDENIRVMDKYYKIYNSLYDHKFKYEQYILNGIMNTIKK
jgi:hypothetical protein